MLGHIKKLSKKQLISTFAIVLLILVFGILIFNGTITGSVIRNALLR